MTVREIPVSRAFLDRLEELLQADERFGHLEPSTLILNTPHGKQLIFTAPAWTSRERRLKELIA